MSADVRPRFSVITVCFNALSDLPGALESLRSQDFADREWIVVDGASSDGSREWLQAQRPDVLVSEPDRGIYDAMNKAIALARGEWLFFLNADDRFADARVLSVVNQEIEASGSPDLVYGDVLYVGSRGTRRKRFPWVSRRKLIYGDLCHQAVFARRSLFERYGRFDATLRYNADFDWLLKVFAGGIRAHYVARDIARFHDGGAHAQAAAESERERDLVRARYCGRLRWRLGNWMLRAELKSRRMLGQMV